jgi:ribonucleoside-triphosphate reductase
MSLKEPNFGPTGQAIYERTYRRVKQDGQPEVWSDTVTRVVDGNLALVPNTNIESGEREKLIDLFYDFKALPAGRHLWMSGVPGRQYLFNCHHAGWVKDVVEEHFEFTFDQLMQGGGVGANYSNKYVELFGPIKHCVDVHIVCDPSHPNYGEFAHLISDSYSHEWGGAIRVEDSREGWVSSLGSLIAAFWNHKEEIVLDLSLVRERGARIRTFGGTACGPGPLASMLMNVATLLNGNVHNTMSSLDAMEIDHRIAEVVQAGNVRRSARMSIKHWADHDIMDFLRCKEDDGSHWTTNISVEIDDDFFKSLKAKTKKGERAREVYQKTVEGMLKNGEPGFYNRSLAQKGEVGQVSSTNPCGEIALEEFENCNLGHVNLDAFYDDMVGAIEAHRLMTRYLVRATFGDVPNEKQRAVLARNRRIGVGHFGFQGFANKRGIRFSDSHRDTGIQQALSLFKSTVREAANDYAFSLRIPAPIKVTTVAPTGTIAKLNGRSEGIHPIYARYFERRVRFAADDLAVAEYAFKGNAIEDCIYSSDTKVVVFVTKESLVQEVEDLGFDPDIVEAANEVPLSDMLAVQAMYQELYADNAVSFTVNISPGEYSAEDVEKTLIHYLPRVKGTTLMVDESREQAPYTRISKEEYDSRTTVHIADGIDEENCKSGACPVR